VGGFNVICVVEIEAIRLHEPALASPCLKKLAIGHAGPVSRSQPLKLEKIGKGCVVAVVIVAVVGVVV